MSERKREASSMKDLMQSYIKESKLSKGMQKIQIGEAWEKLMGQGVASYTTEVQLQNKTLIVRLSSSVLREELSHGKEKIMKMMNEEIGEEAISRIMLV